MLTSAQFGITIIVTPLHCFVNRLVARNRCNLYAHALGFAQSRDKIVIKDQFLHGEAHHLLDQIHVRLTITGALDDHGESKGPHSELSLRASTPSRIHSVSSSFSSSYSACDSEIAKQSSNSWGSVAFAPRLSPQSL